MSSAIRAARSGDIREGRVTLSWVDGRRVALTRVNGQVRAFKNTCPHAGSPLSAGTLAGEMIICSRHGWAFNTASGECPEHPLYTLRCYTVEERDGWVHVDPGEPELW